MQRIGRCDIPQACWKTKLQSPSKSDHHVSIACFTLRIACNRVRATDGLEIEEIAKRILIIDDEENIRRVTRLTLEAAGYDVGVEGDSESGLEAFGDGLGWDAVLLDQRMPGIDGLETLSQTITMNGFTTRSGRGFPTRALAHLLGRSGSSPGAAPRL